MCKSSDESEYAIRRGEGGSRVREGNGKTERCRVQEGRGGGKACDTQVEPIGGLVPLQLQLQLQPCARGR